MEDMHDFDHAQPVGKQRPLQLNHLRFCICKSAQSSKICFIPLKSSSYEELKSSRDGMAR